MRVLSILTISLFFICASSKESLKSVANGCDLKFQGLYKAEHGEGAAYLKFFSDGTVVHTYSLEDEEIVAKWMIERFKSQMLSGKYAQRGCSLSMTTSGETGKVVFKGGIQGDNILMNVRNAESGDNIDLHFEYFEVEAE